MQNLGLMILAAAVLGFGLVSARAQRSVVTPPMVFVALGWLVGPAGLGLLELDFEGAVIHVLAEITLILVLFADAARIDLSALRREHDLPVRLLAIGMPLTIVAGILVGLALLPGLGIWELALLAAILAPTDAALGQAVLANRAVPARIRQALNVESGLNDGIALPVVLVLFSIACASAAREGVGYWLLFGLAQVTLGPLVGAAVGYAGGRLVDRAGERGWITETFRELSAIALAFLAYAGAELIGGNGFIAAFVAGMVIGHFARSVCTLERFAEAEGQLLGLLMFFVFGAVLAPTALAHAVHAGWPVWLYAVASLTVVRMLPVALALWGKGLRPATVLFLGWFGPRGLASILFILLVVERAAPGEHAALEPIVMLTVLLSVFAHGLSASPLADRYGRGVTGETADGTAPEHRSVAEMPLRIRAADPGH